MSCYERWSYMNHKGILQAVLVLCLAMYGVLAFAEEVSDYQLGAGDIIRVSVFQNPDLSVDVRVSESGAVTYPLLGRVELGGLTIDAAEK